MCQVYFCWIWVRELFSNGIREFIIIFYMIIRKDRAYTQLTIPGFNVLVCTIFLQDLGLYNSDDNYFDKQCIADIAHGITCADGISDLDDYNDVIMTTMASQITSFTVVYSTVYSDPDQRKHQSSASLTFVWGIHRDRWIPRTKG